MSYKILLVEDDNGIAEGLKSCLSGWDMEVSVVEDFRDILGEFAKVQPHLVLMDITLPFMSGYFWCQEIRKISSVPIVFVSSAADNMNIVMAMNMGGDDFIAKPFDVNVAVAKIQAILRRTYDFGQNVPVLECRGVVLNIGNNSLMVDGNKLDLTKNEFRIMLTLMQNKGVVVSREKLIEALWESESFIDDNTLSVNVGRLRKKLEEAGAKDFIATKVGVGYIVE